MRGRLLVLSVAVTTALLGCTDVEAQPASARVALDVATATITSTVPAAQASPTAATTPAVTSTPVTVPAATASSDGTVRSAPRDVLRVQTAPRTPGTRLVVLDPGHAEDEVGAAANGVVEKHSNLDFALRVEALLQREGVRVVLTRRADERAYAAGTVIQGSSATRRDLQARVDLANDLGADAFVSLHSNGAASAAERGVETYWNSQRPFAAQSQQLAHGVQIGVVEEMAAIGLPVLDRGIKDDACLRMFQGRCFPLFVLGPPRNTTGAEMIQRAGSPESLGLAPGQNAVATRATAMPGVLVELLFISSPADAALLRDETARDAMARGVARGILRHLAQAAR